MINGWKVFAVIIFILLISVSSGLGYVYAKTSGDLGDTKATLTSTQNELSNTNNALLDTKTELESTKNTLATTQDSLKTTQTLLTNTKNELTDTKKDLDESQAEAVAYAEQLTNIQLQFGDISQGNSYITNIVPYQTVETFLEKDKTNEHLYNLITYNCFNFSADVISNATNEHIRCGLVYILFEGGTSAHAIVAFSTTDSGILFVEPQTDGIVKLEVGKHYWTECLSPTSPFNPSSHDDTVESFVIVW